MELYPGLTGSRNHDEEIRFLDCCRHDGLGRPGLRAVRKTARNERAEKARLREREDAQRQQELDAASAHPAAGTTFYDYPFYDYPYGAQDDGSYYERVAGTFRSRHNRHVNLRRIGTVGAVSGNSMQFRHANARVHR